MAHRDTSGDKVLQDIQVLERRDLDTAPFVDISASLPTTLAAPDSPGNFLRINAIARLLPMAKHEVERYLMEDILSGVHGLKAPLVYLILGTRLKIDVFMGLLSRSGSMTQPAPYLEVLNSCLKGTFPDIDTHYLSQDEVHQKIFSAFKKAGHFGVMTGVPTPKLGVEEKGIEQIERLLRGVSQEDFGYLVIADPVPDIDLMQAFDDIAGLIREQSAQVTETRQYVKTSRLSLGGEAVNRQVQHYVELLELLLEKLELAKAQGLWRTMCYFFSPHPQTLEKMSGLLKSVFGGEKSRPEAIRTITLTGASPEAVLRKFRQLELALNFSPAYATHHPLERLIKHKLVTVLNSRELASLTHLPKEEMPGFDVKDTCRFGVCLPEKSDPGDIVIGEIVDRGQGTGNFFSLPSADLTKHGLVVGVTGSGKTNTCLNLLHQLWSGAAGIPFLVVEPAKSEYRRLINFRGYEDVRIFTLGDETTSPFRLNPFEVMDGVKLQTHIDILRAVFNASFVMYAPMPYVLERCIHEIYQDKGWDLLTNRNRSADSETLIFPTMTDLYGKIDSVVDALGYEDRLTMDIKAGLKARIGSLRIGGKGSMLDTPLSLPMEELLTYPTILELQDIGDDEEKAFLIGLIIARLYEYRQLEHRNFGAPGRLQHLTLIEEAHRILAQTAGDVSNLEQVNTKAKAVEAFCNMLSEIRAFGEGILIAEQIPAKLSPDAIKNTNLKIMHRLVARDDRELVGDTMNLDERQKRFVSIMKTGLAVAFAEGFNEPFLVHPAPFSSAASLRRPGRTVFADHEVAAFMAGRLRKYGQVYGKGPACGPCRKKCLYRDMARDTGNNPAKFRAFGAYLLSLLDYPGNMTKNYPVLSEAMTTELRNFLDTREEVNDYMFCLLINMGKEYIPLRGKQQSLAAEKVAGLLNCYNRLIISFFEIPLKSELSLSTENILKEFQQSFTDVFKIDGMYPGCKEFCKHQCLFRWEVEPFVRDKNLEADLIAAIRSGAQAKERVKEICLDVAGLVSMTNNQEFKENVALCFFIQKSVNWSVKEVLLNIRKWFLMEGGNAGKN